MIKTLLYKSAEDFAEEYSINLKYVIDMLSQTSGLEEITLSTLVGMTELDLIKRLGLDPELNDPRSLIYIIYINI